MKRVAIIGIGIAVALTGCATRKIDPDESGSVPVPGTSWMMFCDGPNAYIWVPGFSGENDELEAVIYDHHKCVDNGVAPDVQGPTRDEDGINEDEGE
jgi:hypothetical protein